MNTTCLLWRHDWKPIRRFSAKEVVVWLPFVFGIVGPARTNWPQVGRKCRRCGKRDA